MIFIAKVLSNKKVATVVKCILKKKERKQAMIRKCRNQKDT